MKFGSRPSVEPELNVTSLLAVILLLVMFFMVSPTFQVDGRLQGHLRESSAVPETRPTDPVTI
ncbi:biopolymer transporter ExbD, partial [Staphylococcus equorum]|uniref:ExbD/TolR family protein n=1 Tax=Staphylococcus equorum TaxID=246432 RepID=UPI0022B05F6E